MLFKEIVKINLNKEFFFKWRDERRAKSDSELPSRVCVQVARSTSIRQNMEWKTRWMWNYYWAKKKIKRKRKSQAHSIEPSQRRNDEIAIGIWSAKTLWQICGLNVQRWYENDLLEMPIILCTRTRILCLLCAAAIQRTQDKVTANTEMIFQFCVKGN